VTIATVWTIEQTSSTFVA